MTAKMILTVGIPGSGKSTWAKKKAEEVGAVIVNRDTIREELYGKEYAVSTPNPKKENAVSQVQQDRINSALSKGISVISDDTNTNPKTVASLKSIAEAHGVEVELEYIDTDLQECIRRNLKRRDEGGRFVPIQVIRKMAERAYHNGHLKRFDEDLSTRPPKAEEITQRVASDTPRWHISPDGKARKCSAEIRCKYAKDGIEPPHYASEEAAYLSNYQLISTSSTVTGEKVTLSDVVSPKRFRDFVERGLISERAHPDDPDLRVYSYTKEVQFSGLWTPETLLARGLILRVPEGNMDEATIESRGLYKFFTVEQMGEDWSRMKIVDDDEGVTVSEGEEIDFEARATVANKLNGALAILYNTPGGGIGISTKGSFNSLEAEVGSKVLASHENSSEIAEVVKKEYAGRTPLFEVITPLRPHPVDYGDREDLIYLGSVNNAGGDWTPATLEEPLAKFFEVSESNEGTLRSALETPYRANTEGFVVTVGEGNSQKLYKVKPQEYHTLRRLFYSATDPRTLRDHVVDVSEKEARKYRADPSQVVLRNLGEVKGESAEKMVRGAQEKIVDNFLAPAIRKTDEIRERSKKLFDEVGGDRKSFALRIANEQDRMFLFQGFNEIAGSGSGRLFEGIRDSFLRGD